jgi:hypothetical protein
MTSQVFEAVLNEPHNDASHLQLTKLIAAHDYGGPTLPAVAEAYLRAFCDSNASLVRRRWVGLALCGMMAASGDVVAHLAQLKRGLFGLGAVILSATEGEETKIIAGLIVRQSLSEGIDFANFWESEKVTNSASNFPNSSGPEWMKSYQDFLDTLGDLALAQPITDPSIVFPISAIASDGLSWVGPQDHPLIAIIQDDLLTVISTDEFLLNLHFMDIPIAHIRTTRTQPSPLHDSQSRETEYKPWDLCLTLKHGPWTYRRDASHRMAIDFTFVFGSFGDAYECEKAIQELQSKGNSNAERTATQSETSGTVGPRQAKSIQRQPYDIVSNHPTAVTRPPTPQQPSMMGPPRKLEQSSPDQLSLSLQDADLRTTKTKTKKLRKQSDRTLGKDMNGRIHKPEQTRSPYRAEPSISQQAQSQVESVDNQISGRISATAKGHPPSDIPDAIDAASLSQDPIFLLPVPKRITYSSGKLPRVSQATKNKLHQHLRDSTDIFDMPRETESSSVPQTKVGPAHISGKEAASQPRPRGGAKASNATENESQVKTSHRKRKFDDDDEEFIPGKKKPVKRSGKRKDGAAAVASGNPLKKRAKNPSKKAAGDALLLPKPLSTIGIKPPPLTESSRPSLIEGLLGLQAASRQPAFKRPSLPDRTSEPPSTPTRPRANPYTRARDPRTPTVVRRNHERSLVPVASSPPLPGMAAQDDESNELHINTAGTVVLSSNSKAVPASPNADSTAISGHADREDVNLEMTKGDMQTAKLDPFKQRQGRPRATAFIRRLTSNELDRSETDAVAATLHSTSMDVNTSGKTGGAVHAVCNQGRLPRSILAAPHQVIDDTQVEEPGARAQDDVDIDGDTVIVHNSSDPQPFPSMNAASHQAINDTQVEEPKAHAQDDVDMDSDTVIVHRSSDSHLLHSLNALPEQGIDAPQVVEQETHSGDGVDLNGDTTLVHQSPDSQPRPSMKASPVRFRSSPPVPGSPSSHSSTSAEPEASSQDSLPTSEAKEMEWEAALQPHQRALGDLLIRVSKRVLRHVVDNETAVTDVADVFVGDGEHLIREMMQRHEQDYTRLRDDMGDKKKVLRKEMRTLAQALAMEKKRVVAMG